jgi:hypothetical protein
MKSECFRGFLGSVIDSKVLCKFSLYGHAQFQNLFDVSKGVNALFQIMVYFINKINQKNHIMTFVNLIN